jgi:purine-nucleoside phosphorylase
MPLQAQLQQTIDIIRQYSADPIDIGVVLGSGLSNFAAQITIECEIPYEDIPNFPVSTVKGHRGKLVIGMLGQKRVACLAGRFHFYEGYTTQQVTYPIRMLRALGARVLLLSNAAGGMHPDFKVGDIMLIRDHISLFQTNPLLGPNDDTLGPRFPDMSEPYHKALLALARQGAAAHGIPVHEGVYVGVTGPTFETRAEYKMLHLMGADAVGMSTVQENIVARHMGMPVFAMSVITDLGIREELNTITHEEVLEAAQAAEPKMSAIFRYVADHLPDHV